MLLLTVVTASAAFWLPHHLAIRLTIANAMLTIVGIMCRQRAWGRGFKPARLLVLSWSSVLIGGTILAMNKFGIVPRNLFTEYAAQAGSALEVVLLSLAMADRFNRERQRQASQQETLSAQQALLAAQRAQNEILENRVRERTGSAGSGESQAGGNEQYRCADRRAQPPLFRSGLSAGIESEPHAPRR